MDKKSKRVPNSLCCPKRPELQRPLSSPALVAISGYDKYERQVNKILFNFLCPILDKKYIGIPKYILSTLYFYLVDDVPRYKLTHIRC